MKQHLRNSTNYYILIEYESKDIIIFIDSIKIKKEEKSARKLNDFYGKNNYLKGGEIASIFNLNWRFQLYQC